MKLISVVNSSQCASSTQGSFQTILDLEVSLIGATATSFSAEHFSLLIAQCVGMLLSILNNDTQT